MSDAPKNAEATAATGDRLRLLVLEPYYGGSHRAVLDALLSRLGWEHDLLTLPARKWKWRMRGAAITMAEEARRLDASWRAAHPRGEPGRLRPEHCWDLVYASTFVNLAEFIGLAGSAVSGIPSVVYFHENQLLYPVRHTAEWDFQFPLTNITSALAADACLFNTQWNLDGFLQEIPRFLASFPDHRPKRVAEVIAAKSSVVSPLFDPAPFDASPVVRGERPRIVWPHRWEHDKDPDAFFAAAGELAAEGLDFEVAVAGQAFADVPEALLRAEEVCGDRLVHLGEPEGRGAYAALLASSDVAVSTAQNEFFGLAMLEACYAGCTPLVPDRLAYPEIYPVEYRYRSPEGLIARLRALVGERPAPYAARRLAEPFTLHELLPRYRETLLGIARRRA